jgi:hypothetical protein
VAIIIERTITINNDKATLDKPIYFYVGDGNITCLFTIKEIGKTARFGKVNDSNIIQENDSIDYGEARIYKPNKDHAETTRAEIIGDNLKIEFNFDNIDEYSEAGVHKLQIHLYDNATGDRNRLTIPPIDINVLMPIGVESTLVDGALVDHSILEAQAEDLPTFDEEGNYNKTDWQTGDIITKNKLNKIEDALYEINAADDNFVTEEVLDTKLAGKANVAHNHTGYATTTQLNAKANTNHTHTGYATTTHTHSDYATKTELANKADINHTHSEYPIGGDYATKDELAGKADINHTHSEYASNNHSHSEYASNNHSHSGYAIDGHIHSNYANINHTHSNYVTKSELPTMPTKVSQLTNDANYISNIPSYYITDTDLAEYNYVTETELSGKYATKDYVIEYVRNNSGGGGETPDPGTSSTSIDDESISKYTVYSSSKVHDLVTQLSAVDTQFNDDLVDMDTRLIYVETEIAAIKDNSQDPSEGDDPDYITPQELDEALANKADAIHTHEEYAVKSEMPTVPTNVSAFTNDAKYMTSNTITRIEVVDVLPEYEDPTVLYIVIN